EARAHLAGPGVRQGTADTTPEESQRRRARDGHHRPPPEQPAALLAVEAPRVRARALGEHGRLGPGAKRLEVGVLGRDAVYAGRGSALVAAHDPFERPAHRLVERDALATELTRGQV